MSVGPLGFVGSIATTPTAQRGADTQRAEQDSSRQHGEINNESRAEKAAGIGETDGDEHGTDDRDADGRRPWEIAPEDTKKAGASAPSTPDAIRQSKDVTGTSGAQLDLTG